MAKRNFASLFFAFLAALRENWFFRLLENGDWLRGLLPAARQTRLTPVPVPFFPPLGILPGN